LKGTFGGSSVKAAVWYFWASPYGMYLLENATTMDKKVQGTLQQVFCAISFIKDDAVPEADCQNLLNAMAVALTMVEVDLPCSELDIKAHNLLHLAERIPHLGPSYTTAMWAYEDIMGQVVDLGKKMDTIETSIMYAWAHAQLGMHLGLLRNLTTFPEVLPKPTEFVDNLRQHWTWSNTSPPNILGISRQGTIGLRNTRLLTPAGSYRIHLSYVEHDPEYAKMYVRFLDWLWLQWSTDTSEVNMLVQPASK
jgi:hypothetical protein